MPGLDPAIVAGLFANCATTMAVFGAAAFRLLIVDAEVAAAFDARLRRLQLVMAIAALVSAVVLTLLEAASMADDWLAVSSIETIGAVLTGTAFGHVWLPRLGLGVAVVACAAFTLPRAPWTAIAAAFLLASLALVGHAAMSEGMVGAIRRLTQAVHLLAAGAWVGGAIPLAYALAATRQNPRAATGILLRFSAYGAVAVALIVASGTLNAVALVGSAGALVGTSYGWALLAKLVLVALLVALASINRFVLLPRLVDAPDKAMCRLRRSVALEIARGRSSFYWRANWNPMPPDA